MGVQSGEELHLVVLQNDLSIYIFRGVELHLHIDCFGRDEPLDDLFELLREAVHIERDYALLRICDSAFCCGTDKGVTVREVVIHREIQIAVGEI